ncbi:MAG TPA: 4-alpha-glucanotransferase [Solimonas sp.]
MKLHELAELAGVAPRWQDWRGEQREVSPENLQRILGALGLPCDSASRLSGTLAELRGEQARARLPPMVTASPEAGFEGPSAELTPGRRLKLTLERGDTVELQPEDIGGGRARLRPVTLPGYHRLELADREITLAVAPPRGCGIADLAARPRVWGLAAQLYGLRRPGDGGIGDFTALEDFLRQAAGAGADAVAISPVHAQFSADIHRYGPYAPSSRLFYNVMHGDPASLLGAETMAGLAQQCGIADGLSELETAALIDWPRAQRLRLQLLRAAWSLLRRRDAGSPDPLLDEWRRYRAAGGAALEAHTRFEALHAAQFAQDRWHWRDWPAELRDPASAAVAEFAARHEDEVAFHVFLQWLAERGLASAQRAAKQAGMAIGLIGDLAVGSDGGGSQAWMRQQDLLQGLTIGAPPDAISALGQGWGLAALSPRALQARGYSAFLEMLRAALRHVGGLRIDHVLGLQRLWLIPDGGTAADGAYLRFPLEDLMRLIALESWRSRALVVGEDLGTVPEGLRERMQQAGLLGMRVLWFERDHGYFIEPARWTTAAMATTSTHDLPTTRGWWQGRDIDAREAAGQGSAEDAARDRQAREQDRGMLWGAFEYAGVVSSPRPSAEDGAAAIAPALRFVSRTPCELALIPLEDIAGLEEQPNLPGTLDEHPNWRRRLPEPADQLLRRPEALQRLAILREERGPE